MANFNLKSFLFGSPSLKKLDSNSTNTENELYKSMYYSLVNGGVDLYSNGVSKYINKGYKQNPHVYTCINYWTKRFSSIKFKAYKVDREGNKTELEPDHKLTKLLKCPNEFDNWATFAGSYMGYKKLTGNAFIYKLKPKTLGYTTKLYIAPSQIVKPVEGSWKEPVKGYRVCYTPTKEDLIDLDKMLHIKEWNPAAIDSNGSHNFMGHAFMESVLKNVQRSNEGYIRSISLFKNGAPPGLIARGSENPLDGSGIDLLYEKYLKRFAGAEKSNIPLFTSANVKWQQMGLKSTDLELLQTEKVDLATIARAVDIPVVLLDQENSANRDNVQYFKAAFWSECVIPELESFRDYLQDFIVPDFQEMESTTKYTLTIDFDITSIEAIKDSINKLRDTLLKEMEYGIWTPDEYRKKLGESSIKDWEYADQRIENKFKIKENAKPDTNKN